MRRGAHLQLLVLLQLVLARAQGAQRHTADAGAFLGGLGKGAAQLAHLADDGQAVAAHGVQRPPQPPRGVGPDGAHRINTYRSATSHIPPAPPKPGLDAHSSSEPTVNMVGAGARGAADRSSSRMQTLHLGPTKAAGWVQ